MTLYQPAMCKVVQPKAMRGGIGVRLNLLIVLIRRFLQLIRGKDLESGIPRIIDDFA
jgi:hypothetical protein